MDTLKYPHRVKARKQYICDYCDKIIDKGEEHTVAVYKDDYIYIWRNCDRCKPFADEAFDNKNYDFDDGLGWQDFHDYMYAEHYDIAKEWWDNQHQI